MGLLNLVKKGVGLAGKYALHGLNNMTGGIAGQVLNDSMNWLNKGKTTSEVGSELNSLGKWLLNDRGREQLSNLADKALKIMPNSKVKNILSKINDAAQGRPPPKKQNKRRLTDAEWQVRKERRKKHKKDKKASNKSVNLQDASNYFGDEY